MTKTLSKGSSSSRLQITSTARNRLSPQGSTRIPDYLNAAVESPYSLVAHAHEGLSAEMVNFVAQELEMPQEELAEILNITPKTLRKYLAEGKTLDVQASELVLKLHVMRKVGLEIFGSVKDLRRWLAAPAFGFDGKRPMTLLKSSQGVDLVTDELYRIIYGDFS